LKSANARLILPTAIVKNDNRRFFLLNSFAFRMILCIFAVVMGFSFAEDALKEHGI
jgi:hypothetical protein